MYWRGPRYRPIGGKMLKKSFLILGLLFSTQLFACVYIDGKVGVNGETHTFNHKVEPAKEFSMPMGSFILTYSIQFPKKTGQSYLFKYKLVEKKSNKLITVTKGEEEVGMDRGHEIYAKGETGQPNSIINLKLKHH